ncbi:short subunit dehydrogenase [Streptomyces sp. TLI_55]|uniref:SDR family NAD(P)-dependent oxidoreductase n=1 Tax=Streptomyces sp. TLI_55 TaxID=1938861 RepID=UPI000BD26A0B|nr:SDR family NAD(P)-dependent oxidoreductase [Streptomyces sp. TLI_55]SNX66176.1 short subunit dehydrogenase [Streptomyces sp. TLI_55]
MPVPSSLDGLAARAQPRVAIVTGGSRGIGRRTVGRPAADGYDLVVGCDQRTARPRQRRNHLNRPQLP